jgi:hypothetical protein
LFDIVNIKRLCLTSFGFHQSWGKMFAQPFDVILVGSKRLHGFFQVGG